MAVEPDDPMRDLMRLRERVDDLFKDVLVRSGADDETIAAGAWRPPVDVWEQGDRYRLRVDLPGVAADDLTIEIEGGALRITGERGNGGVVPRDAYIRAERPSGRFALSIALPPSVDPQGVEAAQKDGVLEITLPRRAERARGRVRVAVK